jgi:hypothetical protein
MEGLNRINQDLESIEDFDDLSVMAFNDLFKCLIEGNPRRILKMEGTTEIIKEMIEHFTEREEYEKCAKIVSILKNMNKYPDF